MNRSTFVDSTIDFATGRDSLYENSRNSYLIDTRRKYKGGDSTGFIFKNERVMNSPYVMVRGSDKKEPSMELVREGLSVEEGF